MSGVRTEGRVPKPRRILTVVEKEARTALRDAASRVALPIAQREAPGGLGAALTSSVWSMPDGFRATIQASPRKQYKRGATGAQVVRWVTRGTGLYRTGPGPKKKITSKRGVFGTMALPGGRRYRTIRGQRPNPFLGRAGQQAREPVERALRQGAKHAATELRKL